MPKVILRKPAKLATDDIDDMNGGQEYLTAPPNPVRVPSTARNGLSSSFSGKTSYAENNAAGAPAIYEASLVVQYRSTPREHCSHTLKERTSRREVSDPPEYNTWVVKEVARLVHGA